MILLDTDTFSLLIADHPLVAQRFRSANDEVAITLVTRIEALEGRFSFLLKAADGAELLRAQEWLRRTEQALTPFSAVPLDANAAARFDHLRQDRRLRRIGRADLLIACIALANNAILVTRNQRHFRQVPGLQLENWAD